LKGRKKEKKGSFRQASCSFGLMQQFKIPHPFYYFRFMKTLKWLAAVSVLLSQFSCGPAKKTAVATEKPTRSLPTLPVSQIQIPVKLYIRPLLNQLDAGMAKEFTSEKWPDYSQPSCDFRYKYRFLRSPITFSCVNNQVNIGFLGSYQIAGSRTACAFGRQVSPWVSGSCGFGNEPLRKVDINISSLLEIFPRYEIKTTTRLDQLKPRDKCTVTLLQTDMTQEIMDSVKASVETYTINFDRFVQALNNNSMLRNWRTTGNRAVAISRYGFLNLNPMILRMSKFNYIRDSLVFSVGLSGTPQFSSDSSSIATQKYLPPFSHSENAGGISAYLNAVYDYSSLTRLLSDSIRNKPFEVEGHTFVVKSLNIEGTDEGKIRLDLSFDGYKKGTLHLSGTPVLDSARQVLSMPDINFSVESRDMLVNIAKGLFRKRILKQLKDQSVLDIAALIEKHKKDIEARLNQPVNDWLRTTGSFQELKIVGILSQKKAIYLQLYMKGNIMVSGTPPVTLLAF
jgi:hypothetical protein